MARKSLTSFKREILVLLQIPLIEPFLGHATEAWKYIC